MWTVTLKVWPQVVTLHLLGGFTVVSIIWLLVQRLKGWSWQLPEVQVQQLLRLKGLAKAGLLIRRRSGFICDRVSIYLYVFVFEVKCQACTNNHGFKFVCCRAYGFDRL